MKPVELDSSIRIDLDKLNLKEIVQAAGIKGPAVSLNSINYYCLIPGWQRKCYKLPLYWNSKGLYQFKKQK